MSRNLLRNLFDQYSNDENRLTNSLLQVISRDSKIARKFLRFFLDESPPQDDLCYSCLYLPGEVPALLLDEEELERRGYPDGWIFVSDFSWVLALETKVTAFLSTDQLERHLSIARRLGSRKPRLLVITAHEQPPAAVEVLKSQKVRWTNWPSVFGFFSENANGWIEREFLTYVRIAEARLMEKGYDGPPLTKFTGIPFDDDHAYNPQEAKVLLRALAREVRDKLARSPVVGINPLIRRPALADPWDVIGFSFASPDENFTRHPHLTVAIRPREALIQFTLPDNAHQEYWHRVLEVSDQELSRILSEVTKRVKTTRRRLKGGDWEPELEIDIFQRHFHARRRGFVDGQLRFRLDTLLHKQSKINPEVRTLPQWLRAFRFILARAREANFELALRAKFPIETGSASKKPSLVQEMVGVAEAMQPLITYFQRKSKRKSTPSGS